MVCIRIDIDDKPIYRVTSIDGDGEKLTINFKDKAKIPRISRWKTHKLTFWLHIAENEDKKVCEAMVKVVKKRKNRLFLKLNHEYMEKWYEV